MSKRTKSDAGKIDGVHMEDHIRYLCDYCGQEIVVPVDISAGIEQEYMEECSVCCRPNVIHVTIDHQGRVSTRSNREQD